MASVVAAVVAIACVRLGLWQLDRLEQRRAVNSHIIARLSAPAVPPSALPTDPGAARFRRVTASGHYDFEREIVLGARTRQGSPGVHLVTPLLLDSGEAVLVNRGWVYSPDARRVDLSAWREPGRVMVSGYIDTFATPDGRGRSGPDGRVWWRLDGEALSRWLPYPVRPYYIVAVGDSAAIPPGTPVRVGVPSLDDGPHRGYAFQWFSFAAIALVGVAVLIRQDVRRGRQ